MVNMKFECKECGSEIKDTDFGTKCVGCGHVPSDNEVHSFWLENKPIERSLAELIVKLTEHLHEYKQVNILESVAKELFSMAQSIRDHMADKSE